MKVGVPEGWVHGLSFLEETLGTSGSRVTLLEVLVFVDFNQPVVDLIINIDNTSWLVTVCFLSSSLSQPRSRSIFSTQPGVLSR